MATTMGLLSLSPFVLTAAAFRYGLVGSKYLDGVTLRLASLRLSEATTDELYELLSQDSPGLFDAIPEPRVGRVLLPRIERQYKQAKVTTNSAGMRSRREFVEKPPDVFRVICLGDSFVMGTGAPENARWGDQLERLLLQHVGRLEGKRIEVYSVGIGSWTAVNAATYLTTRLSEYSPDVVLGLMFTNDIADTAGVRGTGVFTSSFSPEQRDRGSGVILTTWPHLFGVYSHNLLPAGIGTNSVSRWQRTFESWSRLERLLQERDALLILGGFGNELFFSLMKHFGHEANLRAPMLWARHFGQSLPHDPHPNAAGHRTIAIHYLHVLQQAGLFTDTIAPLPALDERLSLANDATPAVAAIEQLQRRVVRERLPEAIDFAAMSERGAVALLGGVYPSDGSDPFAAPPFGAPYAAFLLRRSSNTTRVCVEIELPDRPELYPLRVDLLLDGKMARSMTFSDRTEAGVQRLYGDLSPEKPTSGAIEVVLLADQYWTGITDHTMKSYTLLAAHQL